MGNSDSIDEFHATFEVVGNEQTEAPLLRHRFTCALYDCRKVIVQKGESQTQLFRKMQARLEFVNSSLSPIERRFSEQYMMCSLKLTYYLVAPQPASNMELEREKRRQDGKKFTESEVLCVIKTLTTALLQLSRVNQSHTAISLNSVYIVERTGVYLKDPLMESASRTRLEEAQKYPFPSPQRLLSYFDVRTAYDDYSADLFSVGMVALQMYYLQVNVPSQVYNLEYIKHATYENVQINEARLKELVQGVSSPQLKKTLITLTAKAAAPRREIERTLFQINLQDIHWVTFAGSKEPEPINYSRSESPPQPTLLLAPSPPIYLPPTRSYIPQSHSIPIATIPPPSSIKDSRVERIFTPIRPDRQTNFQPLPISFKQTVYSNNISPAYYPTRSWTPDPLNLDVGNAVSVTYYTPASKLTDLSSQKVNLFSNQSQSPSFNNLTQCAEAEKTIQTTKGQIIELKQAIQRQLVPKVETMPYAQEDEFENVLKTIYIKLDSSKTENSKLENSKLENSKLENSKIENTILVSKTEVDSQAVNTSEQVEVRGSQNCQKEEGEAVKPNEGSVYVAQTYPIGTHYFGYKRDGMRHGHGRLVYTQGSYYQGGWKDNKIDGYGQLYYADGQLAYAGFWQQDLFHGNGTVYNDQPTPVKGKFDYSNLNRLEDEWVSYKGELVRDTKQGFGRLLLSNGDYFQGVFEADKANGEGVYVTEGAPPVRGKWVNSVLQSLL